MPSSVPDSVVARVHQALRQAQVFLREGPSFDPILTLHHRDGKDHRIVLSGLSHAQFFNHIQELIAQYPQSHASTLLMDTVVTVSADTHDSITVHVREDGQLYQFTQFYKRHDGEMYLIDKPRYIPPSTTVAKTIL